MTLWRAYKHVDEGDAYITEGKLEDAMKAYQSASRLAPTNMEIVFWQAVALWKLGKEKEATPLFKTVFAAELTFFAHAHPEMGFSGFALSAFSDRHKVSSAVSQ